MLRMQIQGGYCEAFKEKRRRQISSVVDCFDFSGFINLGFTPAGLNGSVKGKLVQEIGRAFDSIKPECIILPDYNDAHSDHKYVFEAAYASSKIFRRNYIKRIMTMEILSETNFGMPYKRFEPNLYINISDYLEKKLEALRIYDTELDELPFPRSLDAIKAQAVLRGTEAGTVYAEAFRLIKAIE